MSDYQLTMTIESADGCEPQVRVWIDDQLAGDLSSEQEIELVRENKLSWCANVSSRADVFMYRVGIYAAPGSRWTLSLRDAAQGGEELLFDSDQLTMYKEWLVGTCEIAQHETAGLSPHAAAAGPTHASIQTWR